METGAGQLPPGSSRSPGAASGGCGGPALPGLPRGPQLQGARCFLGHPAGQRGGLKCHLSSSLCSRTPGLGRAPRPPLTPCSPASPPPTSPVFPTSSTGPSEPPCIPSGPGWCSFPCPPRQASLQLPLSPLPESRNPLTPALDPPAPLPPSPTSFPWASDPPVPALGCPSAVKAPWGSRPAQLASLSPSRPGGGMTFLQHQRTGSGSRS